MWWATCAGALWVELGDDNRRTGRHKSDDVAQDFGWIVSVVQNHRDQRRARLHTIRLQGGGICSDPLNVSDPALLLAMLKMRQSLSRPIKRVDNTCRPNAVSEREANEAGTSANLQHSITGF